MKEFEVSHAGTPVSSSAPQYLYMWIPPEGATKETVMRLLTEVAAPSELLPSDGIVRVGPVYSFSAIINILRLQLSTAETQAIKALVLDEPRLPDSRDVFSIVSLNSLGHTYQSDWLKAVLGRGTLTSHFQPIVAASDTSQIFGYEALLRASDPDGHPVPPARLFTCAEETGMLPDLDRVARETALRSWAVQQLPAVLFINCTPSVLADPEDFLNATLECLRSGGLPRTRVVLEIVEMEQIHDVKQFVKHMALYRNAGFRLAVDDIGSGYASLNLIHQLRPDYVKIDMELVRGVHQDAYKAAVTQNLLQLARRLSIVTIAEGVEEPDELMWLRENGADLVQGYLIGKPQLPAATSTPNLFEGVAYAVVPAASPMSSRQVY